LTEKPLHVQVAEALGCNPQRYDPVGGPKGTGWACGCKGNNWSAHGDRITLFRYDTDWAATGPLIEKFGVWVRSLDGVVAKWDAFRNDDLPSPRGTGPTPLIAVCNLILELAKAGKLAA
jgi:hypothetical protein